MPLVPQCVVCARPLRAPRRANRQYCGSTCRVRAFRVREKRQRPTPATHDTRRALRQSNSSLVASTRMQLATFRELRQAKKQTTELNAQLTQANKVAAQQRREHEQERYVLQESLATARQQSGRLEAALSEANTLAAAQTAADAEIAERLTAERRRAVERTGELEKAASRTDAAHRKHIEQFQEALRDAQRQLAAVDAARVAAETRNQALDVINEELEAEKKRNAVLLDKLVELMTSTRSERAEHERKLMEEQQQTATERQQVSALRASLREAMVMMRQQRDQIDNTALALSAARAATNPQVKAKLEKLSADLSVTQQELARRTEERDLARELAKSFLQMLRDEQQQRALVEQELSKQKALVAQQQALLTEYQVKMDKVYAQLLRIKEKRDWRL